MLDLDTQRGVDERESRVDQVEEGEGEVGDRRDTECSRHVGTATVPWDQRRRHRGGVLDLSRQGLRCDAPLFVFALEDVARQHDRQVLIGGDHVDADRRHARRGDDRPVALGPPHERIDQAGQAAGVVHDAAEGECRHDQPDSGHHAGHASAREEVIETGEPGIGDEPRRHGIPDALDHRPGCAEAWVSDERQHDVGLEDDGDEAPQERAGHDRHRGGRFAHGEDDHDDQRDHREDPHVEAARDRFERGFDVERIRCFRSPPGNGVQDQRDEDGRDRRGHHRPDVGVEVGTGHGRREVGGLGQRGQLVTEVCTRDHRACGHFR